MFEIKDKMFYEKINVVKLKYILKNPDKYKDKIESQKRHKNNDKQVPIWTLMKNILKKTIPIPNSEYGYIPVHYVKGSDSNNIGRWYAEKSIGLAPLCGIVRHTICDDLWYDIDQVNSHINIMKHFLDKLQFKSPTLEKVINQREECYKIVIDEENCTRDEAKTHIISAINGKNYKTNFIKQLSLELMPCMNKMVEMDEYIDIYKHVKRTAKYNYIGKTVSKILQVVENDMLESYLEYCSDNNIVTSYKSCYVISLIFDGFQLEKKSNINDDTLQLIRKYAFDKIGIDVPLVFKRMDNKLEIPDDYNEVVIDVYGEMINIEKKIEDDRKILQQGYDVVKEEFEKNVTKLLSDATFIRKDGDDTYFIKKDTLYTVYSNLFCYIKTDDCIEKKSFIPLWLTDENMQSVRKVTFDPSRKCGNDIYNKFKGFRAESLPPIDDDIVDELIAPILKHYKDVLYGDDWEYVVELDRQIIQNPTEKSGIILVIKGEQGIGKDIVNDAFLRQRIIGCKYASQCGGISPLFERFETMTPNNLLAICDEVSVAEVYKDRVLNEKIKNLTTRDTTDWEIKGITKMTIPNYINLRWTSNNENPINVPTDDRRYCIFQSSSLYKNDNEYMNKLINACTSDEVARAYYQYLMRIPCKYNGSSEFQKNRPLTDFYKELVTANLQPIDRFLSYIAIYGTHYNNIDDEFIVPKQVIYKGFDLYENFKEWCFRRKWECNTTCTSFGRKISLIIKDNNKAIDKITSNGVKYFINIDELKYYLKSKSRFDNDIY